MLDTANELLRKIHLGEDSVLFEQRAVPLASFRDLEPDLWRRFVPECAEEPRLTLQKMGLLTIDGLGEERVSVAGVLLCSPHPEAWLPNACIEASRFRGGQRDSDRVDATRITGPLDRQIREAVSFVLKQNAQEALPRLSTRAIFEAVVNAVAHRDYSIYGASIRLFHFADRLEIYSPGALPYSMTVDSLRFWTSTRNELVTNLLGRTLKYPSGVGQHQYSMGRRGDGVPIIFAECRRISGRDPEYRLIDDAELLLTIWSAELPNRLDLTPEVGSVD